MARFSASMLDQIRQIDIEKIISPYVELRHKGRDLWGLCPFHNEKSPSFKVDSEKGFFKCFGCDAKGNAVTFVMRQLGFSYHDAVLFIAERFGINIEYDGEDSVKSKDIITMHNEILIIARKLLYSNEGAKAREYIFGRDFNDDDLNQFNIGYLHNNVNYSNIIKQFPKEVLYESGFFKESNYGAPFSRFFNRLVLPIKNITGSIAAFAGRSMDGSNPKYLNSADSSVFHKGETLFNIDKAKDAMNINKKAIIVEGYFDAIRLYKNGFKNAVAPMGTALTVKQINLLKRYAEEIILIFDGDEAGQKAAGRSLDRFIEANIMPKVVFLPNDEDPDSFLLKHGKDKFVELFDKREDLFLNRAKRAVLSAKDDFNLKLVRFKTIKDMTSKLENLHLRDYYIEHIADIFNLKKENVQEDIAVSRYQKNISTNKNKGTSLYLCEMDFIACLSRLPIDVIDSLIHDIDIDMFNDEEIKEILKKILESYANIMDINQIAHELGDQFVELAMREIASEDLYKEALKNKRQIEINYIKKQQTEIIEQMSKISSQERKMALLQELDKITKLFIEKSKSMENV